MMKGIEIMDFSLILDEKNYDRKKILELYDFIDQKKFRMKHTH